MSGDAANNKDDELLSQIDELKARMDRLMAGGTSTSNSALLTDAPRASAPVVEAQPATEPPPPRTRVRDLIGPPGEETEPVAPPRDAVPFPDEAQAAGERRPADRPTEDRPSSPPPPNKPASVDGSLIAVDESRNEPRPRVQSFDELGSAVEQEIAKDQSVPPASSRKGPDLASRFGSVDDEVDAAKKVAPPPEPEDVEVIEDADEVDEVEAVDGVSQRTHGRSGVGAVVAIWLFTGVTSGTIAVLHFAGIL